MKFINGAVVMTDLDTGKPFTRVLSPWELNLVLGQLQALDGGTLNAREIAPFIMRSPGVTEDEARELIETEQAQSVLDRLVGKRVTVQITTAKSPLPRAEQLLAMQELTDMRQEGEADGTFKHCGTHKGGTVRVPTPPQNLPRCDHHWVSSEGRTVSGLVCRNCGDYNPPEWKPAPQCWNCAQPHYIEQVRENDGHCPTCGHEWSSDDE